MISSDNKPTGFKPSNEDFTEAHYRQLLQIAKRSYCFATYDAIPWDASFILWRHDLDISINRALSLAKIEYKESIEATYFVNPRSEFYNPFEKAQVRLVEQILGYGHHLGLHLDLSAYDLHDHEELHQIVAHESSWLKRAFGIQPDAFSFHNPGAFALRLEAETYGSLINCYSRRFKESVTYCSDSNGYWRYRRLLDILSDAEAPCLQVLTHPGWWQLKPIPPRQRIFRAAYGRAKATTLRYDYKLMQDGRLNHAGASELLVVFKDQLPERFQICDLLWNIGGFEPLFAELWRLHEMQLNRLCKAVFRKEWRVPAKDVNAFFSQEGLRVDGSRLFRGVFGESWHVLSGNDADEHSTWAGIRNQLVHGKESFSPLVLEKGCIYVCKAIARLADWATLQPLAYDGLANLGSIGLPTLRTADGNLCDRLEEVADEISAFPGRRWETFRLSITECAPTVVEEVDH